MDSLPGSSSDQPHPMAAPLAPSMLPRTPIPSDDGGIALQSGVHPHRNLSTPSANSSTYAQETSGYGGLPRPSIASSTIPAKRPTYGPEQLEILEPENSKRTRMTMLPECHNYNSNFAKETDEPFQLLENEVQTRNQALEIKALKLDYELKVLKVHRKCETQQLQDRTSEIKELKGKIATLEAKVDEAAKFEKKYNQAQNSCDMKSHRISHLQDQNSDLKRKLAHSTETVETLQKKNQSLIRKEQRNILEKKNAEINLLKQGQVSSEHGARSSSVPENEDWESDSRASDSEYVETRQQRRRRLSGAQSRICRSEERKASG